MKIVDKHFCHHSNCITIMQLFAKTQTIVIDLFENVNFVARKKPF